MTYEMFMFLMYVYYLKMKRMNGKCTFGGPNVVLSVNGGMGHYSYIEQSTALGSLKVKEEKFVSMPIMAI